jgi:hypothetical protein
LAIFHRLTNLSYTHLSSATITNPNVGTGVRNTNTSTLLVSYVIGAMGELRVGENFAFQFSLLANRKGYNFVEVTATQASISNSSPDIEDSFIKSSVVTNQGKQKLLYLSLPFTMVYKKDLGIGKIMFGAGGYYAYCLWGSSKEQNTYAVGSSFDLSLSSIEGTYNLIEKNELQRADYGAVLMTGFEFDEKVQLSVHYSLGLADINPQETTVRNRTVSITLAYLFGDN